MTQASDRPDEPPAAAARWNTGTDNLYGGGGLWVVLPSWPAVHHEGRYDLKFGWWRQTDGQLRVSAASLESTDRVTVDDSDGYGDRGFQPTVVGFTRTGCWLVTGTLGATEVRFVVNVKTN